MICPKCRRDVQPKGWNTGLQELVTFRVHHAMEHGEKVDMADAMEIRAQFEQQGTKGEPLYLLVTDEMEDRYL